MSIHAGIANSIYKAIYLNEQTVHHIEALLMWHNPIITSIFILVIEILFAVVYFLPFSIPCNLCLVIGALLSLYYLYTSFSSIIENFLLTKALSKEELHLHDARSIAAYITTSLSFLIKLIELAFESLEDSSFAKIIATILCLFIAFFTTLFLGDFWTIWILFHSIFILPALVLSPKFQQMLNDERGDELMTSPNAETMEHAVPYHDEEEIANEECPQETLDENTTPTEEENTPNEE